MEQPPSPLSHYYGVAMEPASPPSTTARFGGNETVLIAVALAGVAVTLVVAVVQHSRLWHEGVTGYFVTVGAGALVVRAKSTTWQQRTAKVLLVLAAFAFVLFAVLVIFLFVAIAKDGFPP